MANWGTPKNIGFPINTRAHESALFISLDGKTAYLASDRTDFKEGNVSLFDDIERGTQTDIYTFDLYEAARPKPVTYVKARVFDAVTKKPLIANAKFSELEKGTLYASSYTDNNGEFLVCIPSGQDYALHISKSGYLFYSENFSLAKASNIEKPFTIEVYLQPIPKREKVDPVDVPKSEPVVLKNIFFATGSAELLPSSFPELERLHKLLSEHAELRIQINGHTDNVGSDNDNQVLSENRAKAVYQYLIDKGILKDRLVIQRFWRNIAHRQ